MRRRIIEIRARFFIAVEGDCERAFFRWLQALSEEKLHVHLQSVPLGGGGFKTMLQKAVRERKRGERKGPYKAAILVVDADRAENGDWSIEELRRGAEKSKLELFAQKPNHEGLLLRMVKGLEQENPVTSVAESKLRKHWPEYQKPMNAQQLGRRFVFEDLARAAKFDEDLRRLLQKIGFPIN